MIPNFDAGPAALIVLTWTAGTAVVMWLGELITQRGIGNGMSILIFASVVSRLPAQGSAIYTEGSKVQFFTIIAIGIGMIVGIVFVESGQRRIPVQFAKRVVGRRMYGGQSTYIPLKVNQSGVIPVIFAGSILAFPAAHRVDDREQRDRCAGVDQRQPGEQPRRWYITFYTLLIIFFSCTSTPRSRSIPQQQADIIRKQGGFIPDLSGSAHASAISRRCSTGSHCPGSLFLAVIAVMPLLVFVFWTSSSSRSAARRCSSLLVSRSRP